MGTLNHDEFFLRLGELLGSGKNKDHGAIYLSQKRLSHGQEAIATTQERTDTPGSQSLADLNPENPLPLLIRATNGKSKGNRAEKIKLSTVVEPAALDAFYARYAEICKAGMSTLKPRDRTKRKAKAKKKKNTGGAGTTSIAAIP